MSVELALTVFNSTMLQPMLIYSQDKIGLIESFVGLVHVSAKFINEALIYALGFARRRDFGNNCDDGANQSFQIFSRDYKRRH